MLSKHLALGVIGALLFATSHGQEPSAPKAATNATFEKMKSLVGTWVEADADGKPTDKVFSVIRMTAGGSAIHETIFPGDANEMVSLYHLDQGDLLMTHYCMLGNQPQMKADPNSPPNQIRWQFMGGTNLDPAKDTHMHSSTLTFVDENHVEIAGEAWKDGKPCEDHCGTVRIARKSE